MKKTILIVMVFLKTFAAHAEVGNPWEGFKKTLFTPTSYDLYVPFWAWHNRLAYDERKYDRYNETPYGGGLGTSRLTENDWTHSFFVMAFQDSNYYPQGVIGFHG